MAVSQLLVDAPSSGWRGQCAADRRPGVRHYVLSVPQHAAAGPRVRDCRRTDVDQLHPEQPFGRSSVARQLAESHAHRARLLSAGLCLSDAGADFLSVAGAGRSAQPDEPDDELQVRVYERSYRLGNNFNSTFCETRSSTAPDRDDYIMTRYHERLFGGVRSDPATLYLFGLDRLYPTQ